MPAWLRFILIPAATVAAVVGIGAFLNAPVPFVDAITGATPHVQQTGSVLEGKYIFVMNKGRDTFAEEEAREIVKRAVSANGTGEDLSRVPYFSIAVPENDPALIEYAGKLCENIKSAGGSAGLKKYSKTLLRSRILAGKYDAFLTSRGFTDAEAVKNSDYIMPDAEGMKKI